MKKIVFYIDTMYRGGAQRVICNLVTYFAEKNYDTVLINDFVQDKDIPQYAVPNVTKRLYLRNNLNGNIFLKNFERIIVLRKFIKRENPDVVLSFLGRPNERMLLATMGMKIKKIVSVRSDPHYEYGSSKWKRRMTGWLFHLADGCVFQTEDAAAYFPKIVQRKSIIIFNPVEECFFNIVRSNSPKNIITVGRIGGEKNHKLLIDAFAQIAEDFPDEKLIIYGDGPLRNELKRHIKTLGLSKRVELPGNISEVSEALSEAKLFVLSSDYEGMPNALMEAMAAGIPCISTDCPCGGPKMLFSQDKFGILTTCGNTTEMAEKMRALLNNQKWRETLGGNAAETALNFRKEIVCKKWELYLLGKHDIV